MSETARGGPDESPHHGAQGAVEDTTVHGAEAPPADPSHQGSHPHQPPPHEHPQDAGGEWLREIPVEGIPLSSLEQQHRLDAAGLEAMAKACYDAQCAAPTAETTLTSPPYDAAAVGRPLGFGLRTLLTVAAPTECVALCHVALHTGAFPLLRCDVRPAPPNVSSAEPGSSGGTVAVAPVAAPLAACVGMWLHDDWSTPAHLAGPVCVPLYAKVLAVHLCCAQRRLLFQRYVPPPPKRDHGVSNHPSGPAGPSLLTGRVVRPAPHRPRGEARPPHAGCWAVAGVGAGGCVAVAVALLLPHSRLGALATFGSPAPVSPPQAAATAAFAFACPHSHVHHTSDITPHLFRTGPGGRAAVARLLGQGYLIPRAPRWQPQRLPAAVHGFEGELRGDGDSPGSSGVDDDPPLHPHPTAPIKTTLTTLRGSLTAKQRQRQKELLQEADLRSQQSHNAPLHSDVEPLAGGAFGGGRRSSFGSKGSAAPLLTPTAADGVKSEAPAPWRTITKGAVYAHLGHVTLLYPSPAQVQGKTAHPYGDTLSVMDPVHAQLWSPRVEHVTASHDGAVPRAPRRGFPKGTDPHHRASAAAAGPTGTTTGISTSSFGKTRDHAGLSEHDTAEEHQGPLPLDRTTLSPTVPQPCTGAQPALPFDIRTQVAGLSAKDYLFPLRALSGKKLEPVPLPRADGAELVQRYLDADGRFVSEAMAQEVAQTTSLGYPVGAPLPAAIKGLLAELVAQHPALVQSQATTKANKLPLTAGTPDALDPDALVSLPAGSAPPLTALSFLEMSGDTLETLGTFLAQLDGFVTWNPDRVAAHLSLWSGGRPLRPAVAALFVTQQWLPLSVAPPLRRAPLSRHQSTPMVLAGMAPHLRRAIASPSGFHYGWDVAIAGTVHGIGKSTLLRQLTDQALRSTVFATPADDAAEARGATDEPVFVGDSEEPALKLKWAAAAQAPPSFVVGRKPSDGAKAARSKSVAAAKPDVGRGSNSPQPQPSVAAAAGKSASTEPTVPLLMHLRLQEVHWDGSAAATRRLQHCAQVLWLVTDQYSLEHLASCAAAAFRPASQHTILLCPRKVPRLAPVAAADKHRGSDPQPAAEAKAPERAVADKARAHLEAGIRALAALHPGVHVAVTDVIPPSAVVRTAAPTSPPPTSSSSSVQTQPVRPPVVSPQQRAAVAQHMLGLQRLLLHWMVPRLPAATALTDSDGRRFAAAPDPTSLPRGVDVGELFTRDAAAVAAFLRTAEESPVSPAAQRRASLELLSPVNRRTTRTMSLCVGGTTGSDTSS